MQTLQICGLEHGNRNELIVEVLIYGGGINERSEASEMVVGSSNHAERESHGESVA